MKTYGAGTGEDRKKPSGGRKKQLNSGLFNTGFLKTEDGQPDSRPSEFNDGSRL